MTAVAPRCGRPMRRYRPADPAGREEVNRVTECGRPQCHRGKCRSAEAVTRYYAADARRITEGRKQKQKRDRSGRRLHPPVETTAHGGEQDTCGTYLAYLLHLAKGETPCLWCSLVALRRQTAQAAQADRADFARAA